MAISPNRPNYIFYSLALGISLLAFGYYLSASLTFALGVKSSLINVIYRAVVVLLLIIPWLYSLWYKTKFNDAQYLLLIFWMVYITRFTYDTFILDVKYNNSWNKGMTAGFFYLLLVFNIILPLFAIISCEVDLFIEYFYEITQVILVFSTFAVFAIILVDGSLISQSNFSRIKLGVDENNLLNPIRVSYLGTIGMLTWVFRLFFEKLSKFKRYLLLSLFFLSSYLIILGASKGPLLVAIIAILLITFTYFSGRLKSKEILRSIVFISLFGLLVFYFLNFFNGEFLLFERLTSTANDIENEERSYLFSIAWEMFLRNPVWGEAIFTNSENIELHHVFPHNILLETLMSSGIIGFFFLGGALTMYFRNLLSLRKFNMYKRYAIIMTLSFFLHSLVSGSIVLDVEFWVLLSLSISMTNDKNLSK